MQRKPITNDIITDIFSEPKFDKKDDKTESDLVISYIHKGSQLLSTSRTKASRLYTSESGHCSRKSALSSVLLADGISSPSFPFYTSIGKQVEITILEALARTNVLVFPNLDKDNPILDEATSQFDIPDIGMNLGGKLDAVIYLDKPYILEIKTAGQNLPTNPDTDKPQHVAQARLYSAILGIDSILLYFSRNVSSDMHGGKLKAKEFLYKFDRGQSYKYIFEVALSRYYLDNGFIPPIPTHIKFENKEKACSYCDLVGYCWDLKYKVEREFKFSKELVEPTKHEIEVANHNAHLFCAEFLKPESIKERRKEFYHRLKSIGNPYYKDVIK